VRKRLRVCLAIDVYDIGGGVARIYRKILEHIDLTRFEPILLVLLKEVSEAVPENVQLVRIGTSRARHAIFPLIKVFKTLKPDVVLASKEAVNLAVIVAKKLSKVESKIVVSQHTHLGAQLKYEKGGWFKKKFIPLLMRLLYPYADKVLTVSKAGAQSLRDILGLDAEKVLSLYNPVVDDSILQLAKEEVQHPWFRQDCKEPTIIAVGRLVREKNFSLLLDAMALVCKQIPCNLAIFGEGEEKQELIRQAERLGLSNRVKFMGLVSNPFKYMAKADIFVLSSLWEGLPTALIEGPPGKSGVFTNPESFFS